MIAPAVYLLVLSQNLLGTGYHAKATTFTFFGVNNNCSYYFCHGFSFLISLATNRAWFHSWIFPEAIQN
jgi:hypothetical protein